MKRTILWMSDSPDIVSGYGTMTKNILIGLAEAHPDWEIFCIGWQSLGQKRKFTDGDKIYKNITILPVGKGQFGEDILQSYLNQYKPDVFVTLCDLFMIRYFVPNQMQGKRGIQFGNTKWMPYVAIDGEPLVYWNRGDFKNGCYDLLKMAHKRLTFSKYGQKIMKDEGFDSELIYHGVNTDNFKPLENKEKIKKEMFGDKWVAGVVARNQPRKQLHYLLEAWKVFIKGKEDKAVLYMHTDPADPQSGGMNLVEYANVLGIQNTVMFPKGSKDNGYYSYSVGVSLPELNEIYNTFDIHALQTTGEGFGVPIIESMAAGVPNAIPEYTTTRELIEGRGYIVRNVGHITGSYYVKRGIPDQDHWVETLEYCYNNRDEVDKFREPCVEFAKTFAWELLIPKWEDAIDKCLNQLEVSVC